MCVALLRRRITAGFVAIANTSIRCVRDEPIDMPVPALSLEDFNPQTPYWKPSAPASPR